MFPRVWVFSLLSSFFLGWHWVVSLPCLAFKYQNQLCFMFFTQFTFPSWLRNWDIIPSSSSFSMACDFSQRMAFKICHLGYQICAEINKQDSSYIISSVSVFKCMSISSALNLEDRRVDMFSSSLLDNLFNKYLYCTYHIQGTSAQCFPNTN